MAYGRVAVQKRVEDGDLDRLKHEQGTSAALLARFYELDHAIVVDVAQCDMLKPDPVSIDRPRFVLLENFGRLDGWVMAPPGGEEESAWVEWAPRRLLENSVI
jgi:hypothetical protein